ncbi:Glutathione gamma-glutamylcysteinyltransferase, partial [Choanephora cucurbitarum]
MASRTLYSNPYFKSTIIKEATKRSLVNNKITIYPSTQASRQATTTTSLTNHSLGYNKVASAGSFMRSRVQEDIHLVKFTSVEGKRLFRNAMIQGHAESFFKLMGNFSTQSAPTQGGVSSLAMVLNALEIDPKKIWKGNWRWFSSEQMKTCSPAESVKQNGIPFDEFTCLAQTYCQVQSHRGVSYSEFISDLESVTSNSNSQMVVHFSRLALGQQDSLAHFSPIGGYNKLEDRVLIMDVARGKYPSIWVSTKALYRAMMAPSHEEAGRSRGYFVLS